LTSLKSGRIPLQKIIEFTDLSRWKHARIPKIIGKSRHELTGKIFDNVPDAVMGCPFSWPEKGTIHSRKMNQSPDMDTQASICHL